MNWAAKYVGLPFVDHGRSFIGVDCWGLVQLVMKTEQGIDLPSYGETSALDLQAVAKIVARESSIEPWVTVLPQSIRTFDVVVMYRRRDPVHVGIMVSGSELLHIEEKINAVMVPLAHHSICFRNPHFFRHRDLEQ